MRLKYKYKLLGSFLIIFALFTIVLTIMQQREDHRQRIEGQINTLRAYASTIDHYIEINGIDHIQDLAKIIPEHIRMSIIDINGKVLYDNDVDSLETLANHSNRPEVRSAIYQKSGWNIRESASLHRPFFYYAEFFGHYIVRVAKPYDTTTKVMLESDHYFLYTTIIIFILMLILLYYVSQHFAKGISHLKELAKSVKEGRMIEEKPKDFPSDEIGEIASELSVLFNQKIKANKEVELEREKLIRHFKYAKEGFAIFDSNMKLIYANTYYYQMINLLLETPTFDAKDLLSEPSLSAIKDFILSPEEREGKSIRRTTIQRNGRILSVTAFVFDDNSCEIAIKDITEIEKNRLLKQEITSNIAHELRTPVTSLRGYLETITSDTIQLSDEKKKDFIKKAYQQSIRLSDLIEDISLLSKIGEAGSSTSFNMKEVNLTDIFTKLKIDMADKLEKHHITFSYPESDIKIMANEGLMYAIFHNLMDNSIKYGGDGIEINIEKQMEDAKSYYIRYYDTGVGVEEKHLPKIFERFYRVDTGRTRSAGGSGLGLSIVLNAIRLHRGNIQVKNHTGGGLEYLMRLRK